MKRITLGSLARGPVLALAFAFGLGALAPPAGALDLALYDRILSEFTRETRDLAAVRVDYAGLRRSSAWPLLVASLRNTGPPQTGGPSELAFWINAYNVLAIDLVVREAPEQSLRDLGTWLRPVWKREAGWIGGRAYTLHKIEHKILRSRGDPRIHAAIVCASLSCPPLRRTAFREAALDRQLDEQVRDWLSLPDKGARVDADTLWLSRIFDWFEEDFGGRRGVLAFTRRYWNPGTMRELEALGPDPRIRYMRYDWSLNSL